MPPSRLSSRSLVVIESGPRSHFAKARLDAAARAELTIAANMAEIAAANVTRAHTLLAAVIGHEAASRDSAIGQARILMAKCVEDLNAILDEIPAPDGLKAVD